MMNTPVNTLPYVQSPVNKQRADKFILVITPPKIFKQHSITNVFPSTIQYSVYGTIIPEISIPSLTLNFGNQNLKVSSYARTPYSDITVNFTVDNRFLNYYFIYSWLDILNDDKYAIFAKNNSSFTNDGVIQSVKRDNYNTNSESDLYYTDFTLYSLDEYENKVAEFTYTKAFPINLGSLKADYRDASQYDTTFTFSFSQFYMKLLT